MVTRDNLLNVAAGALAASTTMTVLGMFRTVRSMDLVSSFRIADSGGVLIPTVINQDIQRIPEYIAGVFFTNILAVFLHHGVGLSAKNSLAIAGVLVAAFAAGLALMMNPTNPEVRHALAPAN